MAVGQALYVRRQGPLDFSCAACHGRAKPGDSAPQTITAWQGLPVPRLAAAPRSGAGIGGRGWPVWQSASGELQTVHDKLAVCFWRMGVTPPAAGSDPLVALVAYLTHQGMASERRADGEDR